MSLFYRDKKEEHDHGHSHENNHDHAYGCGCDHAHEHSHEHDCGCGHSHEHSHGCGCEGEEVEIKKLIAGVVVFLAAMIVFHIPGLFQSFDESWMDNIELVVFLLIYLKGIDIFCVLLFWMFRPTFNICILRYQPLLHKIKCIKCNLIWVN